MGGELAHWQVCYSATLSFTMLVISHGSELFLYRRCIFLCSVFLTMRYCTAIPNICMQDATSTMGHVKLQWMLHPAIRWRSFSWRNSSGRAKKPKSLSPNFARVPWLLSSHLYIHISSHSYKHYRCQVHHLLYIFCECHHPSTQGRRVFHTLKLPVARKQPCLKCSKRWWKTRQKVRVVKAMFLNGNRVLKFCVHAPVFLR